ncbi:MAG: hypothetical protein OXC62_11115 [Aestuariivita sp.]|nr:hypothetical protein [Aestuariivita sp.]
MENCRAGSSMDALVTMTVLLGSALWITANTETIKPMKSGERDFRMTMSKSQLKNLQMLPHGGMRNSILLKYCIKRKIFRMRLQTG